MSRRFILPVYFAMLVAASTVHAQLVEERRVGCRSCCELTVEESKSLKPCWDIECKQICVPRIVFPWQNRQLGCCKTGICAGVDSCTGKCCGRRCCGSMGGARCKTVNRGAFVKTVRTLSKCYYECPSCKYTWTPRPAVCAQGCVDSCDCAVTVPMSPPRTSPPRMRLSTDRRRTSLVPRMSRPQRRVTARR